MANKVLWAPETPATLMTTELNSLAVATAYPPANFQVGGTAYANQTNKYRWANFSFNVAGFAAAPAAGGIIELHIIYALDGTNYCDGYDGDYDGDSKLGVSTLMGIFGPVSANNAPHLFQLLGIPIQPHLFRPVIVNRTTQAFDASGSHTLKMYPCNEEVQ